MNDLQFLEIMLALKDIYRKELQIMATVEEVQAQADALATAVQAVGSRVSADIANLQTELANAGVGQSAALDAVVASLKASADSLSNVDPANPPAAPADPSAPAAPADPSAPAAPTS